MQHARTLAFSRCSVFAQRFHTVTGCNALTLRTPARIVCVKMSSLSPPPKSLMKPMVFPQKLMMGPGPSNCPPRVLNACAMPMLGHLHPEFTQVCAPKMLVSPGSFFVTYFLLRKIMVYNTG